MIIKYVSFLLGLIWSYSFIRTQSIFSNKTALLFKVFISKVSWFTFIAACYFGYKNFSFKATIIGIAAAVVIVHLGFSFLSNYLSKKVGQENLLKIKTVFEYDLIVFIVYFILFSSVGIVLSTLNFLSVIIISPELGTAFVMAVIIL